MITLAGWIATVLSLTGVVLNTRKIIWCWPVWICASTIFLVLTVLAGNWPQVALWAAYDVLNVYGWIQWKRKTT